MEGISWSSVVGGLVTIWIEVNVIDLVIQDMPYDHKQFSGYGYKHLHLVLSSYNSLMVGEPAEETVFRSTGSPCTLYDVHPQVVVAMGNLARLDFLVGLVISWSKPTPGCKVVCRLELAHVCSDLCDQ